MTRKFWREIKFKVGDEEENAPISNVGESLPDSSDVGGIESGCSAAGCTVHSQADLPVPRAAHSCGVFGEKIFIFGGWNGKEALNDVFVLDTKAVAWHRVHTISPPSPRNNHASTTSGYRFFVHGGHDGSAWLNDLSYLDIECAVTNPACAPLPLVAQSSTVDIVQDGNATQIPIWVKPEINGALPSPRACHSLSCVGDKVFMFGGYNGKLCFNDIDILDLLTLGWIKPKVHGQLPQPRNAHSMTVVGAKLYLFGGHSGTKHLTDFHVFDTINLTWSQPDIAGSPPPGLRGHTECLVGTKIHFFGGYDGIKRSNELYIFDVALYKWLRPRDGDESPPGRQRHIAGLVGNHIYLFGGFDGSKWLNDLHVFDVAALEEDAATSSAAVDMVSNMRKYLFEMKEFADIVLVVENRELPAHKAILASQCKYFRTMFLSNMKEVVNDRVVLPNWSHSSFIIFLEFLYTGKLAQSTDADVLREVLAISDQFTHNRLKALCETSLTYLISDNNVVSLLIDSDRCQAPDLRRACQAYIIRHKGRLNRLKRLDELQSSANAHLIFALFLSEAESGLSLGESAESIAEPAVPASSGVDCIGGDPGGV